MQSSNMNYLKLSIAFVLVVVIGVAIYGAYQYPQIVPFGASTQGSTNTTAKQASVLGVNLSAPGANATSSSILNPAGQDVYVSSFKVGCEGVGTSKTAYTGAGLLALTVTAATSSTAAPQANSNTNSAGLVTIATSTSQFVEASSTASAGNSTPNYIWGANTYMTFTTNATNTAICTFGVDYFSA